MLLLPCVSPAVELELGCLQTNGLCLLHLSSLQQLASLTLGGNISINDSSWHYLEQLHLPGVTQLSLTGCRFVADQSSGACTAGKLARAVTAAQAVTDLTTAGSAAAGARAYAIRKQTATLTALFTRSSSMDRMAGVLTSAFPSCRNLELGSCVTLSYDGLEALLLGLPQLRVLRLLQMRLYMLAESDPDRGGPSSSNTSSRNHMSSSSSSSDVTAGDRQPYIARFAQRQQDLQQHSAAGRSSSGGSCGWREPGDALGDTPAGHVWRNMQLRHLKVTEHSPGAGVPQSALLAARQQSSSRRSTAGLPALRDLIGRWDGQSCRNTLVMVKTADGMVPLMK
jgi:hypothetical protein